MICQRFSGRKASAFSICGWISTCASISWLPLLYATETIKNLTMTQRQRWKENLTSAFEIGKMQAGSHFTALLLVSTDQVAAKPKSIGRWKQHGAHGGVQIGCESMLYSSEEPFQA